MLETTSRSACESTRTTSSSATRSSALTKTVCNRMIQTGVFLFHFFVITQENQQTVKC